MSHGIGTLVRGSRRKSPKGVSICPRQAMDPRWEIRVKGRAGKKQRQLHLPLPQGSGSGARPSLKSQRAGGQPAQGLERGRALGSRRIRCTPALPAVCTEAQRCRDSGIRRSLRRKHPPQRMLRLGKNDGPQQCRPTASKACF